jgi:dipeptidase E
MRLLLLSSSIVHPTGFLDHAERDIARLFAGRGSVAFVPFAQHDHDAYTTRVRDRLGRLGLEVTMVRDANDVETAHGLFIGGGNTFRLLKTLYERNLLDAIRARVRAGLPYLGSSAGTNVATPTIKTTNDMPVVYPPSFDALGLFPHQINPHYLDADPNSTHKGETREDRLREYLEENDRPVIGLREGSALWYENDTITLLGAQTARVFRRGAEPEEVAPGAIAIG